MGLAMTTLRNRPVHLRGVAAALLGVALLGGCYQSPSAPSLDDAPREVRERAELPSCGRTVSGYVGASSDEGAAECFWNAYQGGQPAEYLWFFFSDGGPSTWVYRLERDGRIVAYGIDADGWVRMTCEGLTSTVGDDRWFGPGFVMDDCERTPLEGGPMIDPLDDPGPPH